MIGEVLCLRYILAVIMLFEMSVSKKQSATFKRNFHPRPRVIHGFLDVNNKYPYVVTLESVFSKSGPLERHCSGSLISSEFVITAAHCVGPRLGFVRCGNMTLHVNESTCLSKALKIFRHPSYSVRTDDIALVQIEKLPMSTYGRLNFADYKTLLGRAVIYAGYGFTRYKLSDDPDFNKSPLMIGEGVIFNGDKKFDSHPQLVIGSKCSNTKQHHGVPHMLKSIKRQVPYTMYTPVSPYVDWIRQVIRSNARHVN